MISDTELENIILDIVIDCAPVNPALDRNEIAQHVIDHLCPDFRKLVYAALERMVAKGLIATVAEDSQQARCLRYRLPQSQCGRH